MEILEGADMRKITNEEIQYVASILEDIVAIGNGSEQVCQLLHFIYIELVQNKYNRTYIPHKKKVNSGLGYHNQWQYQHLIFCGKWGARYISGVKVKIFARSAA